VDVADFLELERALEGDRVVVTTAEEEPVLAVDVLLGDVADRLARSRGSARCAPGMIREFVEQATDLCVAEEPTSTQEEGEEREDGDLAGEGLGRCDADLGSDAEVDAERRSRGRSTTRRR
jgi:hypothetical protein